MKLSEMSKQELINYVDNGGYSDQDVIDLYEDFIQFLTDVEELKNEIKMHRSNYDETYWEEKEKERLEE